MSFNIVKNFDSYNSQKIFLSTNEMQILLLLMMKGISTLDENNSKPLINIANDLLIKIKGVM